MIIYGSVTTHPPLEFFSLDGDTFTITTNMMTLKFQKGAVIGINDNVNNLNLLDTDITTNPPDDWAGFLGMGIKNPSGAPAGAIIPDTEVSYTKVDNYTATLAYTNCMWFFWNTISGANLTYTFVVDPVTGEVSISCTGVFPDSSNPYTVYGETANSMNLPIMNFGGSGTGTIVGPRRIAFEEANVDLLYTGPYAQFNSVPLVVCEGTGSCFAAWSENDKVLREYINTYHTESSHDHIVLHCPLDPKVYVNDAFTCTGGPWRFTVQDTWLDVAKRWRVRYEAMTPDIEYLWNKSPAWVQDIHARYGVPHSTGYDVAYPALITAGGGDASKIICDAYGTEWNGDGEGMFLYGQIDPVQTNTGPSSGEKAQLASSGLKCVSYWYWIAIANDANAWLEVKAATVPADWLAGWNDGVAPTTFNPDYSGVKTDAAWQAYWADASVVSDLNPVISLIHPATAKFLTTQLQIALDWCAKFGLAGLFWDVTWDDNDGNFIGSSLRVTDGKDFLNGALAAAKAFVESDDGYVLICEHFDHRFMPYTFMAYEGPQQWQTVPMVMNHPLRQALIASYMWSKDYKLADTPNNNIDDYVQEDFAYLGCIPALTLSTDYNAPTFGNSYYNARAKMFCDYEMHYDLPTTWDSGVLAYYRCNIGGGVQVKFLKRATGRYAYERTDTDAVILQHELKTGVSITTSLAITFADTYGTAPTVLVNNAGATITNLTTTGCTINLAGTNTIAWLAFGA